MNPDIIGALVCFGIGVAVALLGYFLARLVLTKAPDKFSLTSVLKQIVNIIFLVGIFFIGKSIGLDVTYCLVGGVLGITLPMIVLTGKLIKLNDSLSERKKGGTE